MNKEFEEKKTRIKVDIVRDDGRLERVCDHGIGHPVGCKHKWKDWMGIHGCDGCCRDYPRETTP